jgi:3-dehydroquinate synthetase
MALLGTAMKQAMSFTWGLRDLETVILIHEGTDPLGWTGAYLSDRRPPFLVVDSGAASSWERTVGHFSASAAGAFRLEASEEMKSPEKLRGIWDAMAAAGVQRDTEVAAVGGGLTCDVAALAASTYLRGLSLILIPSTLLAMVDACLGGKTGVNLAGAKNQIGTFHPAGTVVVSPAFLETLPPAELRGAWAEVLKTALIGDAGIAELIPAGGKLGRGVVLETILRCLAVKGEIVASDPLEGGPRMVLNLGHTIGHALEGASGFRLTHGEAVGLGLIVEARIAASLGGRAGLEGEIRKLLEHAGLPVRLRERPEQDMLEELLGRDKKSRSGGRTWALPFDWEDCRLMKLDRTEEEGLLRAALEESLL